jgi:hypothetical protein
MQENGKEKIAQMTKVFLQMKKFGIAKLKKAYQNNQESPA